MVYAGHESKSMLNNSGPRYKRSQLEQQMNYDVIWCVVILLILCVIGAIGCRMWLSSFEGKDIYFLPIKNDPNFESFWTFWTFIIILQVMIPLSLYVTIEFCKILQVYHIHNNSDLFDLTTNKRTECRAMNITEELGQVQHIFSDKTGTLTENKMLFRKCTVNGVDYNHPPSELEETSSKPGTPAPPIVVSAKLQEDMLQTRIGGAYTPQAQRIQEFFLVLSICNTVIVSATPHHDHMNASGMIEAHEDNNVKLFKGGSANGHAARQNSPNHLSANALGDKYTRLTESRSVTPSPPPSSAAANPPNTLSIKQAHVPSLSPINSSAESTPTSDSPPMPIKYSGSDSSPGSRAKSIIASKITTLTSMLNNKAHNKKLSAKLK